MCGKDLRLFTRKARIGLGEQFASFAQQHSASDRSEYSSAALRIQTFRSQPSSRETRGMMPHQDVSKDAWLAVQRCST
jgi:hypothetical protein